MIKKLQKGQSIIEVLVALAVGVLVVSAITIAGLNALNNAQYGRDQTLATKYAQEGIEVVKNLSKTDLPDFSNFGSVVSPLCYCMSDGDAKNATFSGYLIPGQQCQSNNSAGDNYSANCCTHYCSNTPNTSCDSQGLNCKIVRQVKIKQNANLSGECGTSNLAEATVNASWTDGKCPATTPYCHSVEVTSCIDTKAVPTP